MKKGGISLTLFRIGDNKIGGATKMLFRLLQGLDKSQFDITLVSQYDDKLCDRVQDMDISIKIIPFKGRLDTYGGGILEMPLHEKIAVGLRLLQFNVAFQRHMEKQDIILCWGTRPTVTLSPYLTFSNSISIWNIGLLNKSKGEMKYINTLALQSVDYVFIESVNQARRQLTSKQYKRHEGKIIEQHKGVDLVKFDPRRFEENNPSDISHTDHHELCVGTAMLISPRKGLEYFIEAASLVLSERPDVHFKIAGEISRESDKEYKDELQDQIKTLGIDSHVEFTGWNEDMPKYLNSLDLFVLPSLNEGVSGVVREALAMEVPVIATNVGGNSEAIIPGETGYLVEPEDAKELSEMIIRLLSNRSERTELGKQGRRHITENFSMEAYVQNYEKVLREISKDSL